MRQPLRYQIMLPMLGLILTALIGVTVFNASLAAGRVTRQIERQLDNITSTLDQSTFPLTDSVLRQMSGLSGAEFVLVDEAGRVQASSVERSTLADLPEPKERDFALRQRLTLGTASYFHAVKRLQRQSSRAAPDYLHVLLPEAGYREARADAIGPPLAIGLAAGVMVVLLAIAVASRVSRPITSLQTQVERIAEGDFDPLPLPNKLDEVRDLAQAINRMASMLAQYEREIRQAERLRTLSQLGGGIAHQMRNAATGCRMAIDLLAVEQDVPSECESLVVARRQLELMERYIQRFLAIGRPAPEVARRATDVNDLVEELLPLVRPAAQHASVELQWVPATSPAIVLGDREGLEQLIVNLVLNGIEAVNQAGPPGSGPRWVRVGLTASTSDTIVLDVDDSGPGPSDDVKERIFDPFVTGKIDGVGLGLAVARQVVDQHGGRIAWERTAGFTRFRVELARLQTEP